MSTQVSSPNAFGEGYQPTPLAETETLQRGQYDALRSQLRQLFEQFDTGKSGRIASKYLFPMIERFEANQPNSLLKDETRPIFQNWCETNADIEISVDEVLQLVAQLQPSLPTNKSLLPSSTQTTSPEPSPLAGRQRTTPITKFGSVRSNWKNISPAQNLGQRDSPINAIPSEHDSINVEQDKLPTQLNNQHTKMTSPRMNLVYGSSRTSLQHDQIINDPVTDSSNNEENDEESFEGSGEIEKHSLINNPVELEQLNRLYHNTSDLAKRLKESERNLANVARQHEDRIEELQHKLEETKQDLIQRKREIQDHKSKEKTNLHQISALESEILKVGKSLSGQKQMYTQLKKQYEAQCAEAENLKNTVKIKEVELANHERNLNTFATESKKWMEERQKLERALMKLESDVASAQASEVELEEQKNENVHLKATIDKLNRDLQEIRESNNNGHNLTEFDDSEVWNFKSQRTRRMTLKCAIVQNLRSELTETARRSMDEEASSDSNNEEAEMRGEPRSTKTYRLRPIVSSNGDLINDAQLSLHPHELEHATRKQQNRPTRRQVADGNSATRNNINIENQYHVLSSELGAQYAIIENILRSQQQQVPSSHEKRDRQIRSGGDDKTDASRNTGRLTRKPTRPRKRGVVTPIPDSEPISHSEIQNTPPSRALVPRSSNMGVSQQNAVNSTVTFALYTLVIYLFGIITSVFVLDNNTGTNGGYGEWGYDSAREDSVMTRSFQIIFYWIETLLDDGNNIVPT
ncbi:hypothetical protein G9A89_019266 [Geosiphon pyriformis]|nr:hypothetical protein G9A89_019266 [Geosiphon pyriformis]